MTDGERFNTKQCACEGKGAFCAAHPHQPWHHPGCDVDRAILCMNVECDLGRANLRRAIVQWKQTLEMPRLAESARAATRQRLADAEAQVAAWERQRRELQ